MRDIFEELFTQQPIDPVESVRRSARRTLRQRFYREATIGPEQGGGTPILLDGRPVRTPARRTLAAPTTALARALAAEWQAQQDEIDPAAMPLTRLANAIIDGVAEARPAVQAEIGKHLATDLLFYRADQPEGLVARHLALWDPVLAWFRDRAGARFLLAQGVVHVAQPADALAAVQRLIPDDIWRLGAVHAATTLTGSALLALALAHGGLTVDRALEAAHVDEDWNLAQWGDDDLARERRRRAEAELRAAARVLDLA